MCACREHPRAAVLLQVERQYASQGAFAGPLDFPAGPAGGRRGGCQDGPPGSHRSAKGARSTVELSPNILGLYSVQG